MFCGFVVVSIFRLLCFPNWFGVVSGVRGVDFVCWDSPFVFFLLFHEEFVGALRVPQGPTGSRRAYKVHVNNVRANVS